MVYYKLITVDGLLAYVSGMINHPLRCLQFEGPASEASPVPVQKLDLALSSGGRHWRVLPILRIFCELVETALKVLRSGFMVNSDRPASEVSALSRSVSHLFRWPR